MRTLIFFFMAALAGCEKSGSSDEPIIPERAIDTVSWVWLDSYKFATGWDTTGNYMAKYSFDNRSTNVGQYIASSSSGTHRIRYVGSGSLFHPDSVIDRGGTSIGFRINPALKGKPIFEAYTISTNQLYKTYIASKDSMIIDVSFSFWDNYTVPNRKIGEAFLYYISVKQNDGIWYRKN